MTSPISNINRPTTESVTSNAGKAKAKSANESASSASRPAADDTVSLSEESVQVRELQQQLGSIPEVDAEKVEAIKQEIAKGNYPLDPERIAENLLNLEKVLGE